MIINDVIYVYEVQRLSYVSITKDNHIENLDREAIKKVLLSIGTNRKEISEKIDAIPLVKISFAPTKPLKWEENNYGCMNLYRPTAILAEAQKRRANGNLNIGIDFLKKYPHYRLLLQNLFTTDERIEYFINWISACINTIGRKVGTSIVLRGVHGAGKGVLQNYILSPIYGEFLKEVGNEDLSTRFNAAIEFALFLVANEIKGDFRDGNMVYEKIKILITEENMKIEGKGTNAYYVKSYANMMFFSNHATPLQIQPTERRYTVFETNDEDLKDVVKRELKIQNMDNFFLALEDEKKGFLTDLICFDFNLSRARQKMETEETERIIRASATKMEILTAKIKKLDKEFFYGDFTETALATKNFFEICGDCKITNYEDCIEQTVKYAFLKAKEQISRENFIESTYLQFFYRIYVSSTDTPTKMGTAFTAFFGKSETKRFESKILRGRAIKKSKNTIDVVKPELDEDGEPIPF